MNLFLRLLLVVLTISFVLISCGEGSSPANSESSSPSIVNIYAGDDQIVYIGDITNLQGTADTIDQESLKYSWSIESAPEGSSATLSSDDSVTASFIPDQTGKYNIKFTISNGEIVQSDNVLYTVINNKPVLKISKNGSTIYKMSLLSPTTHQDKRLLFAGGIKIECQDIGNNTAQVSDYNGYIINPTAFGDLVIFSVRESHTIEPVGEERDLFSFPCSAPPSFNLDNNVGIMYSFTETISGVSNVDYVNPYVRAMAGIDQTVYTGDPVTLDGSSSTTDQGTLNYLWTIESAPNGSSTVLYPVDSPNPTFIPDEAGEYLIKLEVDNGETSHSDTVLITANLNVPKPTLKIDHIGDTTYKMSLLSPVIHQDKRLLFAGGIKIECQDIGNNTAQVSDYNGYIISPTAFGDLVIFSVRESHTIEPVGEERDLFSFPCSAPPSFNLDDNVGIMYSFTETISGVSNVDYINPYVRAMAGIDQTVYTGDPVTLDGSSSTTDQGTLNYLWTIESAPNGSSTVLYPVDSPNPTFIPDEAGKYLIRLEVDNGETSHSDTVLITANLNVPKPTLKIDHIGDTTYKMSLLSPVIHQDKRLLFAGGIKIECQDIGNNTAQVSDYNGYIISSTAFGDLVIFSVRESHTIEPVGEERDLFSFPCSAPPSFNLDDNVGIMYSFTETISGVSNVDYVNP